MGHALGFRSGTWETLSLVRKPFSDNGYSPDLQFPGLKAISAFNAAGGASYTGAKVPVERFGLRGSVGSHWRESVLRHELMTSVGGGEPERPLSAITIQSLADLGYRVDVAQADAYTLPGPSAGKAALVARAAEEDAVPLTCIVEGPTAMPDKPATIILEVKGIDESE